MTSILKENYHKLILLGNKRNYNVDNKYKSTNENNSKYLEYINKNWPKYKNEINNQLEINSDLQLQNTILNNFKNDEKTISIDNETLNKNAIKENNNLEEEELLGNIKKVIRYKKTVYVNKSILKEKVKNKIKRKRDGISKRGSKYRGVSQNGIGWQAF